MSELVWEDLSEAEKKFLIHGVKLELALEVAQHIMEEIEND